MDKKGNLNQLWADEMNGKVPSGTYHKELQKQYPSPVIDEKVKIFQNAKSGDKVFTRDGKEWEITTVYTNGVIYIFGLGRLDFNGNLPRWERLGQQIFSDNPISLLSTQEKEIEEKEEKISTLETHIKKLEEGIEEHKWKPVDKDKWDQELYNLIKK